MNGTLKAEIIANGYVLIKTLSPPIIGEVKIPIVIARTKSKIPKIAHHFAAVKAIGDSFINKYVTHIAVKPMKTSPNPAGNAKAPGR